MTVLTLRVLFTEPTDLSAQSIRPWAFATVYLAAGRLARGESVLIHAAAGGVGSAAVQLARRAGARVFATAGSDEKLALCRELGADVAINYRKDAFDDLVNEATGGCGVEAGRVSLKSWRASLGESV